MAAVFFRHNAPQNIIRKIDLFLLPCSQAFKTGMNVSTGTQVCFLALPLPHLQLVTKFFTITKLFQSSCLRLPLTWTVSMLPNWVSISSTISHSSSLVIPQPQELAIKYNTFFIKNITRFLWPTW